MDTEQILQAILILTAFLMIFFIIGKFTGSPNSVEEEYSGVEGPQRNCTSPPKKQSQKWNL